VLTPDQARAKLAARFDRDWTDWARGTFPTPLRIGVGPPTMAQRADDPVGCHAFADAWRAWDGPGAVEFVTCEFPTGRHEMPKALIVPTAGQAAKVDRRCERIWATAGARLTALQTAFPAARFDRVVKRIVELEEADYLRLTATVSWLGTNPTSGLLLRQIPVEGIGTKWLEKHRVLVLAMLGDAPATEPAETSLGDDDGAVDDTLSGADGPDAPSSSKRRLHERLGLRMPPELVQVAVLDPALRAQVGGMRHFAASVEDLCSWEKTPASVVILENKETGYAFTDDLPGVVVLHGHGFSVLNYARIDWVRAAEKVVYWGDIDGPGVEFVSDLRGFGVQAESVLMNTATLQAFRHLAIDGAAPQRRTVQHLDALERELYEHLGAYARTHRQGLLLEQERIPWEHALSAVQALLAAASESSSGRRANQQP